MSIKGTVSSSAFLPLHRSRVPVSDTVGLLLKRAALSSGTLSRRETHEAILRAQRGCKASRNQVLECNLALVVTTVRSMGVVQYEGTLTFDDMTTHGTLGLVRAIEKFRPELGYEFSTYAVTWIKQAIMRGGIETGRVIRLPVHKNDELQRAQKEIEHLTVQLERVPTARELAQRMGISEDVARECMNSGDAVSFQELFPDNETSTFLSGAAFGRRSNTDADAMTDEDADDPQEAAESEVYRRAIAKAVNKAFASGNLNRKEQIALEWRYGLNGRSKGKPLTGDAVGAIMGISRERVRQLTDSGLRKLKKELAGDFGMDGEFSPE
jgi:RNA polymerase nonessential primary-like sigma factor